MTHADPMWMKVFLGVHVAAGATSFALAPVALVTAKGGKQHKRWGMVYFWSMGVVAATALPMALYRPVLFLALVAVLSFYLTFSGYRVLKLKDLARGGSAKPIDWIAACVTFGVCAYLAFLGWRRPWSVQHFGVVAMVLGLVGMRTTGADLYGFVSQADGEDVLVVLAPGEVYRQLYRGVDGVFDGDAEPCLSARGDHPVAVADLDWVAGEHPDDDVLQAEVCAEARGCGDDLRVIPAKAIGEAGGRG